MISERNPFIIFTSMSSRNDGILRFAIDLPAYVSNLSGSNQEFFAGEASPMNHQFSSLHLLLDTPDGSNLLLDYYAIFSRRIFNAKNYKSILNVFCEELRKIYKQQHIEIILSNEHHAPVKFAYDPGRKKAVPVGPFSDKNTLYNFVLHKKQPVLTNNYGDFCNNLGVEKAKIPARSWIGIPMIVGNKVQGAVVIWNRDENHFFRLQDKRFLSGVTNMVSFALENVYLYSYITEKNGAYKIFNKALPSHKTRNSIKSVLSQLLEAVQMQHLTAYTGIFLGVQKNKKWRLLHEHYDEEAFTGAGLSLVAALPNLPLSFFETPEETFWHRKNASHFLNESLGLAFDDLPIDGCLVFPFLVNNTFLGAWIVALSPGAHQPDAEALQTYRFIYYLITQLIEKKALLEQANKYEFYMKHLERMKKMGELSSSTAHHLNNILSVIIGKGQLMQKRMEDSTQFRDLDLIIQAAMDGAASIQRLQNYASRKKPKKAMGTININALIQEVVDIVRPRFEGEAQSRGIHYDLKTTLGEVKPIFGNANELREVILNMISNALDAMPRGGTLSLQTTLNENNVLIFISDTGFGIPFEIQHKIFDKFYSTKGKKGNGLGLNIALDIIQRHHGKIHVDSTPPKGSIFMIELPASSTETLPNAPQRPAFYQPLNYKVLLVEDEGIVRETLAEMLEEEGCEVIAAADAADAMRKFSTSQFDLVFADLSMPSVNGVSLARKLKQINFHVPVFIVTGWNQIDPSLKNADEVVDGIIKKPFNMELIRQEMLRIIGRKSTHYHKSDFSV